MAYDDGHRSRLLTAGGILSVVAGVLVIGSGVSIVVTFVVTFSDPFGYGWSIAMQFIQAVWWWFLLLLILPFPREGALGFLNLDPPTFIAIGGFVVALGIIALAGGISSIRRKSFGLSLAGAICALPVMFVGILAVVFVALRKREFEVR